MSNAIGLMVLGALLFGTVRLGTAEDTITRMITLHVNRQPAQSLEGFGCSMVDLSTTQMPATARAEMFAAVFGDLKMNVLRLWVAAEFKRTAVQMKADLYRHYVDSGVLAAARERGVAILLLAPARGEQAPAEPMAQYAGKLAEVIGALYAERGIRINVTGIANEPAGFTPPQLAELVRTLRRELDARGLPEVQIIAPEWASADGAALAAIAGLKSDPIAWAALRGIATHSYNMAATPEFSKIIAGTGKQYWMTEASDNGNEGAADVNRAASICGRFLNDLNQGVTHWVYFIGFDASADVTTDQDNATKLMVYDGRQQRVFRHLKYDWFRQLRAAFPNGSRIYCVQAQPGNGLVFSYGQKPYLNAAAAQRPDGSWALGLVNLSGITPNTAISQWHPGTTLNVTWLVEPLTGNDTIQFNRFRSDAIRHFAADGQSTMVKGRLTLVLKPGEQITLTSNCADSGRLH